MNETEIKSIVEIDKKSKVGALVNMDKYEDFAIAIQKAINTADLIGGAEKLIAQKLEAGKDIKRIVDANAKQLNKAGENIRAFTVQFMQEMNLEKLEGDIEIKSITLQKASEVDGVISTRQIKLGKTYIDLSDVSKKELVEALEKLGIKTRIKTEKATSKKPASVRVQK